MFITPKYNKESSLGLYRSISIEFALGMSASQSAAQWLLRVCIQPLN